MPDRNNVIFESVSSPHIKQAFLEAYEPFTSLHTHTIIVRRLPVINTTMRAQPVLNSHFWSRKKRHYRIDVSNHAQLEQHIPVQELPLEVLIGWFAHELGHIRDYQDRGPLSMLQFGAGYLLMPTFRSEAERQADLFAIERGFAPHLLATKKYILEQSSLPDAYKKRIQKFYMSPDEIVTFLDEKQSGEQQPEKTV